MENYSEGDWIPQHDTLSEFLLAMLISQVALGSVGKTFNGATSAGSELIAEAIKARYTRLPFPEWHWPPEGSSFYGDADTVIWIHHGSGVWPYAATRSKDAWSRLDEVIQSTGDLGWEWRRQPSDE